MQINKYSVVYSLYLRGGDKNTGHVDWKTKDAAEKKMQNHTLHTSPLTQMWMRYSADLERSV